MNNSIQDRLCSALEPCLRLLARIMLRSGIGYTQFVDLAKTAFVEEALGDRDTRGRATNLSRVAIRTGISRKEVSRIKSLLSAQQVEKQSVSAESNNSGHAARVLQLWHADKRFVDELGCPRDLPFGGEGPSFSSLVKAAGGDVPPGAVRAELIDAAAVVEIDNGSLKPLKRYFVPADVGEDLLVGFTHFVLPVLSGLAHNTERNCDQPFIQRLAYSDRLTTAALPLFREISQSRASSFLQGMDDWLSTNESSVDSREQGHHRVGIGVFYYEGNQAPRSTDFT
jgi:hypothetical protein